MILAYNTGSMDLHPLRREKMFVLASSDVGFANPGTIMGNVISPLDDILNVRI